METRDAADNELIEAFLGGSETAFEALYLRYRRDLYGYLWSMLPADDVDDVCQRTWLRVCAALPRYRSRQKFRAWLFRIGRNQAIDRIRSRKRRGAWETGDEAPDCADPHEPWQELADAELRRQLEAALAELGPEQRAVFRLRREAVSYQVIAARQNCTVGTAVMRMHYAMRKLKRLLGDAGRKS